MANRLDARHVRIVLVCLALSVTTGARAQEASQQPATATPSGQKAGAPRKRFQSAGRRTTPPAAGFDHQAHARASRTDARMKPASGRAPDGWYLCMT